MYEAELKSNTNDKVQSVPIYKFIKNYISFIPVRTFHKGEYLYRGEDKEKTLFYILNGFVEVENVTYSGKKIVVENVESNTFIGPIADMYEVDLQSSGVAVSKVEVLVFSESVMDELMKNDKFSVFFYQETSSRICKMYKTILSKILFSSNEIMAYYILNNSENGVFAFKSTYSLRDNVGISRRGIYNILYRFEEMNYIKKKNKSEYQITDRMALEKHAKHVTGFMRN